MKYTILNCPCLNTGRDPNMCIGRTNRVFCKDVHTCLIKELIFESKKLIEDAKQKSLGEVKDAAYMYTSAARVEMAKNLLDKFEIEEIDESYWDEPNVNSKSKHKNRKHK